MALPIRHFRHFSSTECLRYPYADQLGASRGIQLIGKMTLCSKPNHAPLDESMVEYLVCPLSKKPLRYDKERNELVSDSIGVAYPVINGIPNLVPQDGRILEKTNEKS